VLAGLYNASVPIGMGFAQYDPDDMTPEVARYIIERYNEINPGEDISFDYLKGRPLKCHFKNNILYARNYNANNAPKLAQRVVSRCKNVREIKLVQEKKDN
ncbi:MAG: hypothetical protein Q4F88_07190, partial [Eubacteriales bacterium]|nr:hypothetical protein [Eubacteriales bacterium]